MVFSGMLFGWLLGRLVAANYDDDDEYGYSTVLHWRDHCQVTITMAHSMTMVVKTGAVDAFVVPSRTISTGLFVNAR